GELDLLTDEQRGLGRDVADDVAERLVSGAVRRRHQSSPPPSLPRTLARMKPPARAASTGISGRPGSDSAASWACQGDWPVSLVVVASISVRWVLVEELYPDRRRYARRDDRCERPE